MKSLSWVAIGTVSFSIECAKDFRSRGMPSGKTTLGILDTARKESGIPSFCFPWGFSDLLSV
jgi:hypothetical protein